MNDEFKIIQMKVMVSVSAFRAVKYGGRSLPRLVKCTVRYVQKRPSIVPTIIIPFWCDWALLMTDRFDASASLYCFGRSFWLWAVIRDANVTHTGQRLAKYTPTNFANGWWRMPERLRRNREDVDWHWRIVEMIYLLTFWPSQCCGSAYEVS